MRLLLYLAIASSAASAQPASRPLHPLIQQALGEISEQRISATIHRLSSFGSRNANGVVVGENAGVAAASRWIYSEFQSYGGKLEVRYMPVPVSKGGRFVRDTEIVNVVAVLPGASQPGVHVLVGAHYDSLHIRTNPAGGWDMEATAASPDAPGAADNASGVACVMELARVLANRPLEKTVVFVAFSGEEQGLVGAGAYAKLAADSKQKLEAVLNVDTIGTDVTGNGIAAGPRVNVYSGDPMDSPSRSLARLIRDVASRYQPGFSAQPVFRSDRFGRGGDHTPFHQAGFAAVRFTTPAEQLENQHNGLDTPDRVSMSYTANVTRAVGAALMHLALAPKPPSVGPIARGASHYDAGLRWKQDAPEADLTGFSIVLRATTSPFWEREIFVGNSLQTNLKNILIDETVLGVRAVDKDGLESLTSVWAIRERAR